MNTDHIVLSITQAIVNHQIKPGARLVEQRLGEQFGVSRTVVRQALYRLAENKLVELEPARGAMVASPSIKEARQVFAVRRTLELQMLSEFMKQQKPSDLSRLRSHLRQEGQAVAHGRIAERTGLLSEFHVLMAELSGNLVMADLLSDLASRCALIAMLYQSDPSAQHSHDDHRKLVDLIEAGRQEDALDLMNEHLLSVERSLVVASTEATSAQATSTQARSADTARTQAA